VKIHASALAFFLHFLRLSRVIDLDLNALQRFGNTHQP